MLDGLEALTQPGVLVLPQRADGLRVVHQLGQAGQQHLVEPAALLLVAAAQEVCVERGAGRILEGGDSEGQCESVRTVEGAAAPSTTTLGRSPSSW